MRGTVFIFAKAARAGAVKTRLAADIGAGRACALFCILTERTVFEVSRGPWRTIVAIDDGAGLRGWENIFPGALERRLQGGGDLGARMARAFAHAPPGPAIIVGADAPGLRTRHIRSAFKALHGADAVFGPAADGGYWLIGLARRRPAPDLFAGVRWSTKFALSDTQKTLPPALKTVMLDRLTDIDEARDLVHLGPRSTR